jgi:predicted permease
MEMILQRANPVPRLVPMHTEIVGAVSRTMWMVAAVAILVLIVTCANVANLLLVRADSRSRELSVRSALGAGRHRILAQFFTEVAVLSGISTVMGLGIAAIGIRQLINAGPAQIPRLHEVHVDGAVVVFTAVVAAIVALACSAIPAIRCLRDDPLAGLREGARAGTPGPQHQRAREALVIAQVAFALVVLTASGLLLRSFQRLHAVKAGFDADGLATLSVSLTPQRYPTDASILELYTRLLEQATRLPGVTAAALTSRLPLGNEGTNQTPFYVEGAEDGNEALPPLETYATVDGDYFKAMGIPIIAGHALVRNARDDRVDNDQAVIGQETARVFFHDATGRAALNQRFQSLPHGRWYTVVGVAGNVRDTSLSAAPARMVYLPATVGHDGTGQTARTVALVMRTRQDADVSAVTRAVQRMIHGIDPTLPTFDVRSMRATMDASIARLTFTTILLAVAAAVTLILSVVGLYGVIAYVVTLRKKEFGVRVALGAQPSSVAMMMAKQGLRLSGAGIMIGLALVLLAARFVGALLFEVAPTDPVTLAAATTILIVFALLATWIPVRRALHTNPVDALRAD